MRILIIGGTGLISTAITQALVQRGEEVVLYNRGRSEYPTPTGVRTLTGDRTDYPRFEAQMREAGLFDCVIDMVGYAPEDEESAVRAFRGRTGQFIFCSTVDVYRKPAPIYPVPEDAPQEGRGDYAANKVRCEAILRRAHEEGAFPVTIIRPACTLGEGRGPLHSLGGRTTYLDRIRRGKPIVVHGDGSSIWVVCHRDDVAAAFVAAAGGPHAYGRAYHVTGEEWLTWNEYHRQVAEALGAPEPELVHIPTDLLARATERARICLDNFQFNNIFCNDRARADLGFRYTVTWRENVQRMARWLDEHGRVEDSARDPLEDRLIAAWQRLGEGMVQEMAMGEV